MNSTIQSAVDDILRTLGVRMVSGQMVIHFDQGRVQKIETNTVHKPQKAA